MIKETAIELLADKGYHDTTVKLIAESAGISVGSIYTHFENKEDIINCIFEDELEKRVAYMESLDGEKIVGVDKLTAFIDFHFDDLMKNKKLALVLIRESTNPALRHLKGIKLFTDQCKECFEDVLMEISRSKKMRDLDPTLSAQIILSIIRGAVFELALGNENFEELEDIEDIKQEIKKFISFAIMKN